MRARANDKRRNAQSLALAFCFAVILEVIAHGKESVKALPASRVPGADSGGLVPEASAGAKAGPAEGERGLAWLVLQGRLDPGTAAGPADAGALLPGVRGQGVVDHVVPFRGDWALFVSPANHQSLCKFHHDQKTAGEQAEGRRKAGRF